MNPNSIRFLTSQTLMLMVLVAFVLVVSSVCLAQEKTPVPEHDGPYVFWHDSATATVFYLCQGEVHEQTFEDFDTLRFHKFCEEEAIKHAIPVEPPAIEPAVYTEVPRIFVVSDIHGEIEALLELLKAAGVIDDDTHWNWGDGHMVIDGDIFDRGDRVTEVLWLVYRLEQEARRAGGRVHYLIGNHDEMVIHGDNRYVHDKYTKGIARKARIRHQDLFGPSMELGRWLRTKPTIMRLNDVLFVHGGISPELVERGMTIESVNEQMRRTLTMNSGQIHFSDVPKFLLSSKGPLWYRGFVMDLDDRYDRLAKDEVASILEYFEASAVVVGHTETDQIEQHYDGLVYTVDVPLDELGTLQGLLWESGKFYRVTGTGVREVWE